MTDLSAKNIEQKSVFQQIKLNIQMERVVELIANWSYPTTVWFGAGRLNELEKAVKRVAIQNPLIVTDRNLSSLPIVQKVKNLLPDSAVFSEVDANPTDLNLNAGIKVFKAGGHDGVIAFGGGSALDLGKLIAFAADQVLPIWKFEDVGINWKSADHSAIYPSIAIPTTAGTGSEVGRAGILTNSELRVKKIIFHPQILPALVICDPELTIGMPQKITVGTGLDAFSHCLEAYSTDYYHPMSQGIALEGMRLVKENLPRVVKNADDIKSRAHMMSAALMGAVAFQKGLGAIHAISHPIGALFNTHHGMTNAVLIPYILKFNREKIENRIADVANYLGISGGFDGFYEFILQLRETLKVPNTLGELGVTTDNTETIAKLAVDDPTAARNPVKLTIENVTEILRESI